MSVYDILGIGRSGMTASAFGATNASQNASNATTEGYSRRLARFQPEGPWPLGGVRSLGATRVRDRFIEQRMLGARGDQGFSRSRVEVTEILDTVFADAPGNLQSALAAFQTATTQLAANPKDATTRAVFLESADALAGAFRRTAEALDAARREANDRVGYGVAEVDQRLEAIGALSKEIGRLEVTGAEASDLRDRRDQLIREVGDRVPIRVIEGDDGRVEVLLAGQRTLVDREGRVTALGVTQDATTGDARVVLPNGEDVTSLLRSGSIGGLIEARDGAIAEAVGSLDQLAFDVSQAYNAVHSAGFGLDGGSGRNLFAPLATVAGAARAIGVSADVAGRPDAVAAASDAAELPGDNRNAVALEAISRALVADGGTTSIESALASMVGQSGARVQAARLDLERTGDVAAQVSGLRQAVSGVNTDEEMIDLAKYQRSFQASARVIQVADEMLAEIVNLKR